MLFVFVQCHEIIANKMQPRARFHVSPSSILPSCPFRLVPLSISDTHLHAHPREATLATTRSLEERRRTGVRILIYTRRSPQFNYSLALFNPHQPPQMPYFIFSNKTQFKRNGTRVCGGRWARLGEGGWIGAIMLWVAALIANYT